MTDVHFLADPTIPAVQLARALASEGLTVQSMGRDQPMRIVRSPGAARPRAFRYGREILFVDEKRIELWPTPFAASERLKELDRTHFTGVAPAYDYIHWPERNGYTLVPCGGADVEFAP